MKTYLGKGEIGPKLTMEEIARRAWNDRLRPDVYQMARGLTRSQPDVFDKVGAIVDAIKNQDRTPPADADDMVSAAAAMCLSVGIPCRIVGARFGQSWTCWLAYQDEGGGWTTVDVQTGRDVASMEREPDERMEAKMPEDDGVQIRVDDNTTYNVRRCVTLNAADPEHPSNPTIEVSVGGSVSSYKNEATLPRLQLPSNMMGMTRKQWELVKRLGDRAWNEYERRFPYGQK